MLDGVILLDFFSTSPSFDLLKKNLKDASKKLSFVKEKGRTIVIVL